MSTTRNIAGKSTRKMAADRKEERKKNLQIRIVIAILALIIFNKVLGIDKVLGIGIFSILGIVIVAKFLMNEFDHYDSKQIRLIKRAERGAQAEEEIGELLKSLDDGFVVLHDLESPYGNIDHVVISQKGGILLLETKAHHGKVQVTDEKILVNGKMPEKDFVMQALKNSFWVRECIEDTVQVKPWIYPIVVFTNAFVPFGEPVKGVRVTNAKYLLEIIRSTESHGANTEKLWENRNEIIWLLMGDHPGIPVEQATSTVASFCPKCGKKLVSRMAQRGPRKGMTLMVCPDYPSCYIALDANGKSLASPNN